MSDKVEMIPVNSSFLVSRSCRKHFNQRLSRCIVSIWRRYCSHVSTRGRSKASAIWGTAIKKDRGGLGQLAADIGTGYWNATEIDGKVIEIDMMEIAGMDLGAACGRRRAVF